MTTVSSQTAKRRSLLGRLGPGLITGASDDDPSGIATYSQAGAQFGYSLLWTLPFSIPLMSAIQEICARIGRVTGHGIAGNIRRYYSPLLLYPVVISLLLANIINLGADIGAMGDALALVIGGPALLYAVLFALLCVLLQIFVHYDTYSRYLKWLTFVLFSYVTVVFTIHVPWTKVLRSTFIPSLSFHGDYWTAIIAIFGTTISPYLFFWQAAQETEEIKNDPNEHRLKEQPGHARAQFGRIHFDTYIGMILSNSVAFFIMLVAATTLHDAGIRDIQTSTQAAQALRPLAGPFAFLLFALGIVGTGLLAVPVLAGSAAYAVGEALHRPTGLSQKPHRAKTFYAILSLATLFGLALNFPFIQRHTRITPIKALYYAAILNGLVAVPIMVVILRMARNTRVMGKFIVTSPWLRAAGWLTTILMAAAAVGMFITWKN